MSNSESNIRKYVWTFRKCKMSVENAGEYTLVKKTPEGETQETIMTDDKGVFWRMSVLLKMRSYLWTTIIQVI